MLQKGKKKNKEKKKKSCCRFAPFLPVACVIVVSKLRAEVSKP